MRPRISPPSFFKNKFAVITGGSEGIGRAAAIALVALGSDVIIAARDSAKLAMASTEMEVARTHPAQRIATISMDVTDGAATSRQMDSLTQQYGSPDLLINSAGFAHPGYLDELDVTVLKQMMDVNYFGTVHTVKALLPAMRKAGRGHIVNVSSMAGYLGLFGYTGYCASKYAVVGFSAALRQEVRPYGIAVSVLCPPNTKTPGLERENRIKPAEIRAMEERAGIAEAADVVTAMLRALPRRPFLINPTLNARLSYMAACLAPQPIVDCVLRRPV